MNSPHSCRRAPLPARLSLVLSAAVCALALSGCGNKGPLVLPEDAPPAQAVAAPEAAPAATAPADAPPPDAAPDAAPVGDAAAGDAATDAPADTPDPPPAHD